MPANGLEIWARDLPLGTGLRAHISQIEKELRNELGPC